MLSLQHSLGRVCSTHGCDLRSLSLRKPRFMSCCKKASVPCCSGVGLSEQSTATLNGTSTEQGTYEVVKDYYGKVLSTTKDLKTSACTASGKPHAKLVEIMRRIPQEITSKFYGCGAPLPLGIKGLRVLDLGSGSGRDCYLASALVQAEGQVTGIDMTEEQIQVAEKYVDQWTETLGYSKPNLKFIKGHIEYLDKAGIEDESVDIIISNCVVNLSPDKQRVLNEAYRVLAPGGELYFSDVYSDRRLPEEVRKNEVLWGECISGALYVEDFKRMAHAAGFGDPRVLSSGPISITDEGLKGVVGNAAFSSITYRLFKLPGQLETECEDYGQVAIYKGTIEGQEHLYALDKGHVFQAGKPMLVCGNSAAMVGENGVSWLAPHFTIIGDRSVHYGLFANCGTPGREATVGDEDAAAGGSCC